MFVRVVFENRVTEVMIQNRGFVYEALDAANVPKDRELDFFVTGVPVCTETRLRDGDILNVVPYGDDIDTYDDEYDDDIEESLASAGHR